VGIAIDAVIPELFDNHRASGVGEPHRWKVYMQSLEDAVGVRPLYDGVHLIVGWEKRKNRWLPS
jgi:biotin synthase-related radical SAM superfamily protein